MDTTFQGIFGQSADMVTRFLPNLLGAVAILVAGWLAALVLSSVVRAGLKRTTIDNRVAQWVTGGTPVAVERHVGSAVFWLAMLFVAIAVLQTLQLAAVAAPVNDLLAEIARFAPRLGGAVLLLVIAWAVARILKTVVTGALRMARLDERLRTASGDGADVAPVSDRMGEAVYWLVFLLFLPAILSTLALQGLLGPVQSLVDRLLGFLPNLFGAALILVVGWFIANLVRRIVTNLLAAVGTDALTERLGLRQAIGSMTLSALIGLIAYVLVLLPVIIAALDALALQAVTAPASNMLTAMLQALPALFGAALVLAIAFAVGRVVGSLVSRVLSAAGFDTLLVRLGLATAPAAAANRPSAVAGTLVFVALMLFASMEAAGMLGFETVRALIFQFLVLAGHIVLGLIVFGLGLFLAGLAHRAVLASGTSQAAILAPAARVAIVVLAGAMALRQMGLANEIVTLAFGLLLGSLAVAAAIAFGLGARNAAGQAVDSWAARLRSR